MMKRSGPQWHGMALPTQQTGGAQSDYELHPNQKPVKAHQAPVKYTGPSPGQTPVKLTTSLKSEGSARSSGILLPADVANTLVAKPSASKTPLMPMRKLPLPGLLMPASMLGAAIGGRGREGPVCSMVFTMLSY